MNHFTQTEFYLLLLGFFLGGGTAGLLFGFQLGNAHAYNQIKVAVRRKTKRNRVLAGLPKVP